MALSDTGNIQAMNQRAASDAKTRAKLEDIEQAVNASARIITKYFDNKVTKTELVNQLESVRTPDVKEVTELLEQIKANLSDIKPTDVTPITSGLKQLQNATEQLGDKLPRNNYSDELKELIKSTKDVERAVKDKDLNVSVASPKVNVDAPDLKPLHEDNKQILEAIKAIVIPETDTSDIEDNQKEILEVLEKILAKPVAIGGGGGGGVQTPLIRDGNAIAVVNPDGSNIGGGSGGGDASAAKQDEQTAVLEEIKDNQQTDALTDDELRATPIDVNIETTNYTDRLQEDSENPNLTYIGSAPVGSSESDAVWQITRLDETGGLTILYAGGDDSFTNQWTLRESLVYS